MRFPKKFSRWKGPAPAGGVALGTDTVPTTGPSPVVQQNLMVSRFNNVNGWPCHRVAVTYKGPALAPTLPAHLWFWEDTTSHWYKIGDATLKPNEVVFFDNVGILEQSQATNEVNPTGGSIGVLLIVDDNAAPNGEYVFALAPDLTTF